MQLSGSSAELTQTFAARHAAATSALTSGSSVQVNTSVRPATSPGSKRRRTTIATMSSRTRRDDRHSAPASTSPATFRAATAPSNTYLNQ